MNVHFLTTTALFRGAAEEEIGAMLDCLGAESRVFSRDEVLCHVGEPVTSMGLILSGSVIVENNDVWGNRSVLDVIGPGQVFAETYACVPGEPLMVSVVAVERTEVLFLEIVRLFRTCSGACAHQAVLLQNLLSVTAQKNLHLSRRIFHTSSKSIRGRLLSYLSFESMRQGGYQIVIPFNRQQLADYLGVDRSALSNELSKMRREGLLTYEKNRFTLRQTVGSED